MGVYLSFDFKSIFTFFSSTQGDPELVSAIYGRGIAYGKKSLQVSDSQETETLPLPVAY